MEKTFHKWGEKHLQIFSHTESYRGDWCPEPMKNSNNSAVKRQLNRHFSKKDIWVAKKHRKRHSASLVIQQNKSRNYNEHITHTTTATVKETDNHKCWRECREIEALIRSYWEFK